ncbi:MAG TPA: wax ester/triacylglycerol synthase family O-acyltransferase [Thermoleophilaceae bacterium]
MRQLTSLDAQFLAVETPRTYGHVGGLAVYDPRTAPGGRLEIADVCKLVSERLHMLPPFRWRLVQVPFGIDHPYWVEDPDFDLDFHIRESAIPPPGDDRSLGEVVSRIFARPLDRSRPLWELYLIHGLKDGRVAMLTKVHHSVVDGVSGAEILSVLLDLEPEGREIPPPEPGHDGERVPTDLEMLGRGIAGLPRQPLRALRAAPSTLANLVDVPGVGRVPGMRTFGRVASRVRAVAGAPPTDERVLERQTGPVPRTRFNGPISAHRRYAFGSISLDTVKALKNEMGITVNDVVVTICATAVREWLIEHDELPEEPLVSMIPVSVRAEHEFGSFGNRVSMMIVPIPTNVADPRARLLQAHEYLRGAKERHQAIPANLLTDATAFIPPAVAAMAARTTLDIMGRVRPPLNLVISNVPGPRERLYCAGAELQAHFPVSVIADGVGLNITAMSYREHIDFGIVADRNMIDDVWPLMEGVKNACSELNEEICGPKKRSRATRARQPAKAS